MKCPACKSEMISIHQNTIMVYRTWGNGERVLENTLPLLMGYECEDCGLRWEERE